MEEQRRFCPQCGTTIFEGTRFCPSCGAAASPLPASTGVPVQKVEPPAAAGRFPWLAWAIGLPLAAFVIVFGGWKLLTGFPVERQPVQRPAARTQPVVVEEQNRQESDNAAEGPYTIRDLEEPQSGTASPAPATTTMIAPPVLPPGGSQSPAPAAEPHVESAGREISADTAMLRLAGFLRETNYYGLPPECVAVTSLGYRNAGYTLEANNRCSRRPLGRWRVDAITREVFVRNRAGRYVRP